MFASFATYKNIANGNVYSMSVYRLPSLYNMFSLLFLMGLGNRLENQKCKLLANIRRSISKSNGKVQRYLQNFGDEVIVNNLDIRCGLFVMDYRVGFEVNYGVTYRAAQ